MTFEMPSLPPKPGEMWLSIELTKIEGMPIADVLARLQAMGYQPGLRYRQWKDASGNPHFGMFALLKHEQHDPDTFAVDSCYDGEEEELEALAAWITPTDAISCPRGLPRRTALAA